MCQAYTLMCDQRLDMTTEVLERQIEALRNPVAAVRNENPSLVIRFRKYADSALRDGVIGENRYKHIMVVSEKLERFLIINGISKISAEEFDVDHLMEFREFMFDEYHFVEKYPKLYEKVKRQNRPEARLSMNTVTSQLKMFQTFFTELENLDEIRKSPFRKLGKDRKKSVMKTIAKEGDEAFIKAIENEKEPDEKGE